ncbi:UNVERIFIED_CONTAM: hypothetical protein FKN15_071163 [Acipenser sinensis]
MPEWGEPKRPQPKRGELVRPQPKREESVRPQPKREESVHPQPKEGGVGACTALGPKLPAEGECLLVPPPPAEEQCLLSPCPPAEEECLLSLCPPAECECLLVSLPPPPPQSPARKAESHQSPAREAELHQSPAREAEQHQSPAKGGDYTLLPPPSPGEYTLLPPPSPGDHTLLPPPLLPPQEPEGEELQAQPPEIFLGGEGQDAGVPRQPLFLLLKAARRAQPQPPQRREPAPPGAEELELPLPPPPPGAEELELPLPPPPPGAEELELPLLPPLPGAEEQELSLLPVPPPQGVWWPEPHKGELPATKKGGEVRRPAPTAAVSLSDWTSMLSAVLLPAGVLTALPAMGPLKPPFPARDFVLDCWVFKGGGGR